MYKSDFYGSIHNLFCTGILHLFPKRVFRSIVTEIDRVLKPNGKIIIDFATDIRRTSGDGKEIIFEKEPKYTLKEAEKVLKGAFGNYNIEVYKSSVNYNKKNYPPYRFKCNFILLSANKKL